MRDQSSNLTGPRDLDDADAERATLFAFDGVWVEAGGSPILSDVTVELPDIGIVAIEGPSGAGKSTLLRLCNRLAVPDRGRVSYRGRDIATLDPLDHRRRVGMVFQRPIIFDGTVLDNLRAADPGLAPGADGVGRLLTSVGLDKTLIDRDADTLSGGEAQRLCMARALATGPEVLLLDEPTSSLDDDSARLIEDLAIALAAGGLHQVWVSHDKAQVARLARWRVRLDGGRVTSSHVAS